MHTLSRLDSAASTATAGDCRRILADTANKLRGTYDLRRRGQRSASDVAEAERAAEGVLSAWAGHY